MARLRGHGEDGPMQPSPGSLSPSRLAPLLALSYVAPLWHIELDAPQYPEGLGLVIWVEPDHRARSPTISTASTGSTTTSA